jgi:hypothetical protein
MGMPMPPAESREPKRSEGRGAAGRPPEEARGLKKQQLQEEEEGEARTANTPANRAVPELWR